MEIEAEAEGIIRLALAEDLGTGGDITTRSVCPEPGEGRASVVCRGPCTVAGQPVARRVFELAGPGASYTVLVEDGGRADGGGEIARVEGPLDTLLAGERTALNFLCRLSGIATLTAGLVALAAPYGVKVMDTRKTTPGLRALEKYAVRMGGGTNHRFGLYDAVLIKDNHIAAAGGVGVAVRRARDELGGGYRLEVEASTMEEVREALDAGADVIMLDNMDVPTVREAVALVSGRAALEVSGGVTPGTLAEYAAEGVDMVSLGFLTHSAPAADIALELERI